MSEMKGNEMIDEEINEEKIKVLTDYAPIVNSITIREVSGRYASFYNVKLSLKGWDLPIETKIDTDLVNYICAAEKLGKKAFKAKELVREENMDKGKQYLCIKFTLTNGKVFRYFLSRANESTIDLLFEDYKEKNKK